MTEKTKLTKQANLVYVFILGFLLMVQTLVTDMFLPAFPKIVQFFQVPDAFIQYSLSAVMLGAAVGFFSAGPLSDSLGRKLPVLFALGLFSASSVALFYAPGVESFVVLRFFQGLAGAAAAVVAQAIIRDMFVGDAMLKMLGRVWLVAGLAPMVSPFIAANLMLVGDWRIVPAALAILGAFIFLIASKYLVETLHVDNRRAKGFEGVIRRFTSVFRDRIFLGLLVIGMFQTIALFSYLNNVPFLYQDTFGLSQIEFSLAFSSTALTWFAGIQLGARLGARFKAHWVVFAALALATLAGSGLYIVGTLSSGLSSVLPLVAVYMFSFGLTVTPVQTIALQGHGSEAGTAASVLGVMTAFTAAIAGPIYPLVGSASSANLGIAIALCHLVAILAFFFVLRPNKVPELIKD